MNHGKLSNYLISLVLHTVPFEPQSPRIEMIPNSPLELQATWDICRAPAGALQISTNAIVSTSVVPGTASEATVSGLTPYTWYECYVTANTSVGEGSASQTAAARTDESSK